MSIRDFVKHILAPNSKTESDTESDSDEKDITRQDVLDALIAAFKKSLKKETTTESMLCHTFYKVYINNDFHECISATFHKTGEDAVKAFTRTLKSKLSEYPDFQPFATRWEFQLIPLNEGSLVQGMEEIDSDIAIVSRPFAPGEVNASEESEREVVTIRDAKNSMREITKGFNFALLHGLIAAERDKVAFRFTLDDNKITQAPKAGAGSASKSATLATIRINGGTFIEGNRTFTSYTMKSPTVRIAGKNGTTASDGIPVVCINSDTILNHHVEIAHDSASGSFKIAAQGETRLNEMRLNPGNNNWYILPSNSNISIGDFDLTFKI